MAERVKSVTVVTENVEPARGSPVTENVAQKKPCPRGGSFWENAPASGYVVWRSDDRWIVSRVVDQESVLDLLCDTGPYDGSSTSSVYGQFFIPPDHEDHPRFVAFELAIHGLGLEARHLIEDYLP